MEEQEVDYTSATAIIDRLKALAEGGALDLDYEESCARRTYIVVADNAFESDRDGLCERWMSVDGSRRAAVEEALILAEILSELLEGAAYDREWVEAALEETPERIAYVRAEGLGV